MIVSIVVPNNGRDISAIREVADKFPHTEVLEIDLGLERSVQRNIGIRNAKGEYIFILDSDQIPTVAQMSECIRLMNDPEYQGIYIPEVILGDDWLSRLRNFERLFYTGTVVDCVRFVRRPCPLFNVELNGPEDADFDLRIKGKKMICRFPLYHNDNLTLKEYIKKKAYYVKGQRRFKELHPDAKVLDLRYRCFIIFIENGKWKLLLRHPIMTFKLVFLLIIRGIIYFENTISPAL